MQIKDKVTRAASIVGLLVLTTVVTAAEQQLWQASSSASHFNVAIGPLNNTIPIGNFHHWKVSVQDREGRAVDNAQIAVSGGMLDHGHGMPSQPLVTRYLGNGEYLLEGMLFNMAGAWTLVVKVQTTSLSDQVRFNIDLKF